ncbi:hypothetical protein AB4Z21_20230 [Paenibacillus sp. MCAF20]
MKQKVLRIVAACVLIGAGVWIGVNFVSPLEAESNTLTPGSVEDPVVTKSYVDEQLAKINGGGGSGGGSSASATLEVVAVPAGKILLAGAGTEVIVRVGKALAYSVDTNGVADLTDGTELKKGTAVPANHLLIFPREGRGIQPDPAQKNGLTVLVRGSYVLQ